MANASVTTFLLVGKKLNENIRNLSCRDNSPLKCVNGFLKPLKLHYEEYVGRIVSHQVSCQLLRFISKYTFLYVISSLCDLPVDTSFSKKRTHFFGVHNVLVFETETTQEKLYVCVYLQSVCKERLTYSMFHLQQCTKISKNFCHPLPRIRMIIFFRNC